MLKKNITYGILITELRRERELMKRAEKITALLLVLVLVLGAFSIFANRPVAKAATKASISYSCHQQTYGDSKLCYNGASCGVTGQAKRVEALRVSIKSDLKGNVVYNAYCQKYGWRGWKANGQLAGTSGEAKRMEAVMIKLTGEIATQYSVYYRVHIQKLGWSDWKRDGETAGTTGQALRLEAFEIKLVKKGTPEVAYTCHQQTYGDSGMCYNGENCGVTGQAKRLEALRISLMSDIPGSIVYQTHCEKYGWMGTKKDGQMSGTSGEAKRMEAVTIKLTGEIAKQYSVYYRLHVQKLGWLDWACDGEAAGTEGFAWRVESIQIRLVKKGSTEAGRLNRTRRYVKAYTDSEFQYNAHIQDYGDTSYRKNFDVCGLTGQNKGIEGIRVKLTRNTNNLKGTVKYKVYVCGDGWTNVMSNGTYAGTTGQNKGIEAVTIELTDELREYCDVYYRVKNKGQAWLGWAKNGQIAGSGSFGYEIEAIQMKLVRKTLPGPGVNDGYYKELDGKYRDDITEEVRKLILSERQVSNDINVYRNPTWNEHLEKVARARVKELVTNFSHDSAGNYRSGYCVSEAIYYHTYSYDSVSKHSETIFNGWYTSPNHYSIMVSGDLYALATYQYGRTTYCCLITSRTGWYIAEEQADKYATEWVKNYGGGQEEYKARYEKKYNNYVKVYGERKIW